MNAVLLNSKPIAGVYPEHHFGDVFNHSLWVEFEDNNFNKWYGCFARTHMQGFNKLLTHVDTETAFIVAGGTGYLVDIANKKLLTQIDKYFESAISTQSPNYFIVGTFRSIYILNNEMIVKEITPDFFVDGIYFTGQQGLNAIGDLYSYDFEQDCNVYFELNLLTFEIAVKGDIKVRRSGYYEYEFLKNDKPEIKQSSDNILKKIWHWITS